MLVFVDPKQGTGKSSTLRALCPDRRWFTDSLPLGARPKEIIELLAGKWIVEVAELAGMRRTEIEQVKAFLSRQSDSARLAYGRLTTEVQRHWVPFGTTNQPVFLKDAQNRRYWPVRVGRFDTAAVARDRDQLWAEAVAAHKAGESVRLDPSLWARAAEEQQAHALEDPWLYAIEEALGDKEGRIATADLFKMLRLPRGVERPEMGSRVAEVMRKLGWSDNKRKVIRFADRKVRRGWLKGNGERTLIAFCGDPVTIEYWGEAPPPF
jgi:predicted P-loop ATPase